MKKRYKLFVIAYFILMVIAVLTTKKPRVLGTTLEYVSCGSANGIPRPLPQLTTIGYTLLIVGTPLILITFSIVTLLKAIASNNQEEILKAKNKLFKKFMSASLIFLMATIVQFVITRFTTTTMDELDTVTCMRCFMYYSPSNCPDSSTGNDVETGSHRNPYDNLAQPTTQNRKMSSPAVTGSLVASADGKFMWPLPSPYDKSYITSYFGGRVHPITGVYQKAHGALDIGAAANTPIYEAADGTVVISEWHDSYGNYVKIDHGEGWSTLYAHQTKRNVTVGQTIRQGEVLGFVGTTGSSTGNHLHFEVRYNNERLDPLQFFK